MITLILDTADNKKISVGLNVNNRKYIQTENIHSNKKQMALSMIDEILRKYSIKLEEVSAIQVNMRHGSLTGLRVGIAVANALSFSLKIPINEKKIAFVDD